MQSKAQLYFAYEYQAHFQVARLNTAKAYLWQDREHKSGLSNCVNIHIASNTGAALHH